MLYAFYRPMTLDPYRVHVRVRRRDARHRRRRAAELLSACAGPPAGVTVVHVQELGHVVVKVRDAQRVGSLLRGARWASPWSDASPIPYR